MVTQFHTETVEGSIIDDFVVVLRAKSGVTIDIDEATAIIAAIEAKLTGDYGILVDRVNDYSVSPVGVYQFLNTRSRLRAMALVLYRPISMAVSDIETSLANKPIKVFDNVDAANTWLRDFSQ